MNTSVHFRAGIHSIFAVLVFVFYTTPSYSQACDPPYSGNREQIASTINRATEALSRVVSRIESVPPSEAEYIEREESAALTQDSKERFRIVLGNKFYHPLQVHKHFKVIFENLKAAQVASANADRIVFLGVVLSRYSEFASAINDYQDFDARRKSILTSDDRRDISFTLTSQKHFILVSLQCSARQMKER